jgi:hypothetical protein
VLGGSGTVAAGFAAESATATQRYGGLELTAAYRLEQARGLTPYVAVAGNFLDTRFQVDALELGVRDRTRQARIRGRSPRPAGSSIRSATGCVSVSVPSTARSGFDDLRRPTVSSTVSSTSARLVTYQFSWSTLADVFRR